MSWESRNPGALRIDPDAERPTLIGSTWARRVPEGDDWDFCKIVAVFDTGNDSAGLELCVQTVVFGGQPVMTADAEAFAAAYRREEDDDPAERVAARLRELEAVSA